MKTVFDYKAIDRLIENKDDDGLKDYMMHVKLDWHLIKKEDLADLVVHCIKKKMEYWNNDDQGHQKIWDDLCEMGIDWTEVAWYVKDYREDELKGKEIIALLELLIESIRLKRGAKEKDRF